MPILIEKKIQAHYCRDKMFFGYFPPENKIIGRLNTPRHYQQVAAKYLHNFINDATIRNVFTAVFQSIND